MGTLVTTITRNGDTYGNLRDAIKYVCQYRLEYKDEFVIDELNEYEAKNDAVIKNKKQLAGWLKDELEP